MGGSSEIVWVQMSVCPCAGRGVNGGSGCLWVVVCVRVYV